MRLCDVERPKICIKDGEDTTGCLP